MTQESLAVRVARRIERDRTKKIGRMVHTAARKLADIDFQSGAASIQCFGRYDYAGDAQLKAIVTKLFDDPTVAKIHIPRMAVKRYSDGEDA